MILIHREPFTDFDGKPCEVRVHWSGEHYEVRPFRGEHPFGGIVYRATPLEIQNAFFCGFDSLQSLLSLAKSTGQAIAQIQAARREWERENPSSN